MKRLIGAAALTFGLLASFGACAHDGYDRDHYRDWHEHHERERHEHEWRERAWREHEWREHEWRERERWHDDHRGWYPVYAPAYRPYYPVPVPVPVYPRAAITIGIPPIVIPLH
ncbi:hypothetical protein GCM10025771_06700 [Niveibacterium umoris]|uniref:Lipoprotein n=1 Tax=Niveibacterium umoris TaxID=1193620 RepID=A0A840BMM9_9RHOO|nr:hypothetical protein [Niveibacterium umoris]MBB4013784.1 hypothetical protein [Niveibacterium umoris]